MPLNPVAIEQAKAVSGLRVNWDKHEVTVSGNEQTVIDKLVFQYKLDLRKTATIPELSWKVKNCFSSLKVAMATPLSDKTVFNLPKNSSMNCTILRKSSKELFGKISVEVCKEAASKLISQLPADQQPSSLK